MTDSAFGRSELSFGPGKLFWDTGSGGTNQDLGGTDQITITKAVAKLELRESQAGDRPADRAITSQTYQVAAGLSRATLERLEAIVQGVDLEFNSLAVIIRVWGTDHVGELDSSIQKQLTFNEIINGALSTNPFNIIDFFRAAPMTESTELVYDAVTQRYYGVVFESYRDPANTFEGREAYWASRELVP